jgi:hypothetical protein
MIDPSNADWELESDLIYLAPRLRISDGGCFTLDRVNLNSYRESARVGRR